MIFGVGPSHPRWALFDKAAVGAASAKRHFFRAAVSQQVGGARPHSAEILPPWLSER